MYRHNARATCDIGSIKYDSVILLMWRLALFCPYPHDLLQQSLVLFRLSVNFLRQAAWYIKTGYSNRCASFSHLLHSLWRLESFDYLGRGNCLGKLAIPKIWFARNGRLGSSRTLGFTVTKCRKLGFFNFSKTRMVSVYILLRLEYFFDWNRNTKTDLIPKARPFKPV